MTVQRQVIAWVVVFAVFVTLLVLLREILFPFVAGFAIAYFLDPLCDRLEKMGLSRTWATTVVTAVFFVLFIVILAVVVPVLSGQIIQFLENLPRYLSAIEEKTAPLVEFARGYISSEEGPTKIKDFLQAHIGDVANFAVRVLGNLMSGLEVTFNLLSLFIITPIVAFYLLRDWDHIVERIDSWLPRDHAETIREQIDLVDETLAGFLRGQFTVCLLLGAFYGIGLSIVGLQFGLVVGFGTGLVSFVPYFGMLIGFVVGMALAVVQFDTILPIALVAAVFGVGQIIEGNFLTPKLVGDRVNLHAVWIIFGLMAGGALFGFVGVLLAIPIAAVVGVLVRFSLSHYLGGALYLGTSGRAAEPPPKDDAT